MEIRKRKQVKAPARPGRQPQPINSEYAAEVRRRAEKLTAPAEKQDGPGQSARNLQRQQTERDMAKLRSEAVQARRLAEHIENLSHGSATNKHERKHAMTDTTIIDPGHAQRLQRRAQDKPAARGRQMNFNPLHPSMELPPEQLIRLLGMESKKIRKSRKSHHAARQTATAESTTADVQKSHAQAPAEAAPQIPRPADRSIQYERCEASQVFDSGRSGLLVPALLVGVVAGIAVSGYLFWFQPAEPGTQATPASVVTAQPKAQRPERKTVERSVIPATPAAAAAKETKMTAQESAEWQAAVAVREQQLRSAAEQRLSERVQQLKQTSRAVQPDTAPINNTSALPVMPAEPTVTAPEPVMDAVMPSDTPVAVAVPVPSQSQSEPATGPQTPDAAPTASAEVVAETASSSGETQRDMEQPPVTPLEQGVDIPAPVESLPQPEVTTGNEAPVDEPAPAVSDVMETATETGPAAESEVTTPVSEEAATAISDAPGDEMPADTTDNVLF